MKFYSYVTFFANSTGQSVPETWVQAIIFLLSGSFAVDNGYHF